MAIINKKSSLFDFSEPVSTDYYITSPSISNYNPLPEYMSVVGDGIDVTNLTSALVTVVENSSYAIKKNYDGTFYNIFIYEKTSDENTRICWGLPQSGTIYIAIGCDESTDTWYLCRCGNQNNQYGRINLSDGSGANISLVKRFFNNTPIEDVVTAPGGGATHIAKVTGHLSALSSNLSDILIVAGGGGGGMIIDSVAYDGADAGGISGSGTNSANQTTGYAFGQGESGSGVSGGGGGLYGGYKGSGGSSPSPVPPEYESYIDIINGSGFWWKDYPNKNYYNANQAGMTIYPPTLLSWISNYDDYSYNFTPTAARTQYCNVSNIQDVYITSNNNVYSVNHVISGSQQAFLYNNEPGWVGNVFTNQTFATSYLGQNPDGTTLSTSGTLAQVLSWMTYRFRNVNIYVDNICWSKVN